MQQARISIGIVTIRERFDSLRRLLNSIHHQEFPANSVEIVVVPNMDSAEWELRAQALGNSWQENVKILNPGRRTLGHARNELIEHSSGEILCLIDDDCYITEHRFLSLRYRLHQLHPNTVIGGFYANPPGSRARHIYNDICNSWTEFDPQGWKVLGGNVSYPRQLLLESGLRFDSTKSYGGNENSLHIELWKRNIRFYKTRSVSVVHDDPAPFGQLMKKALAQGQSRAKEGRKPGNRPSLKEIASLFRGQKQSLGHLSYYIVGEIGFFSRALADRLSQKLQNPKDKTAPIEQMAK